MKRIVVGSTNPTKIDSTRAAFEAVWPDETFEVTGVKVKSGVSEQPMSFDETIRGAKNRARAAMLLNPADFAVGLEAGVENMSQGWFDSGWCAVLDSSGSFGIGSSPVLSMPDAMMEQILSGKELGQVVDEMTDRSNVKHQEGFFGIVTNGAITRSNAFEYGIAFALARFVRPDFYTAPAASEDR